MQKILFFISIVSLSSIVQAFDNNKSDIQYQEVVTVDIGKLMGAWKCTKCFWLNSRDQSKCDKCGYYNEEIEKEIKRRKEQNLKETLKEIFLMLKNNDEAVDLFNGRIYINPKRLVYKEGKYYIQDDNMNYVLIDQISEDIYGYYIYVKELEKIMKEDFDFEMVNDIYFINNNILCIKSLIGGGITFEKSKKGKSVKAKGIAEISSENDVGNNHSLGVTGQILYKETNQEWKNSTRDTKFDGEVEYSFSKENDNTYSIGIGGNKTCSSDCSDESSGYIKIEVDY